MTVHLVGAGPGDPGLLTLRGAAVLRSAEVVVYDRLAEPSLLDLAPPEAERLDVGKRPGAPVAQADINRLLVDRAAKGLEVVRLKGGDPFVFGRGGEEAAALAAAGIPFEVVPGVTSAVAVPAYAGVPVTHRGLASSFTVVTGHLDGPDVELDWEAAARLGGTLVLLMAVAHRGRIAGSLMAAGMDPATPTVAVTWGTRAHQKTVRTTVAGLAGADIEPPATIVIGAVAGVDLAWFSNRPLLGWRVLVTRAASQASGLTERLRAAGADPVEVPTIEVVAPADGGAALATAVGRVRDYRWLVVTSANGVAAVRRCVRDARALAGVQVAAVGPATADALEAMGIAADLLPESSSGEALAAALPDPPSGGGRVLLARAAAADPALARLLAARGWDVDEAVAYRTVPAPLDPEAREAAAGCDAVLFASGSAVRSFLDAAGAKAVPPVVVCIGPKTAEVAEAAGLTVDAVAPRQTLDGLVDALTGVAASRGRPPRGRA